MTTNNARGIFATRDLMRGDFVVVEKAIAIAEVQGNKSDKNFV